MGKWEFNTANQSSVQQELTQRDQFNNDEVSLSEALVREVIQNSADARSGTGAVKVRFGLKQLDGAKAAAMKAVLAPLHPHFDACGIDRSVLVKDSVRVLTIEDFNTRGLTGATESLDEDNFRNFFRRHGRSGKGGKSGGRWGLGKIVYSSSSSVRVFFGITLRKGETSPLLMGQAVLSYHTLGDELYEAHGFYHSGRGPAPMKLQLPITDATSVAAFSEVAGATRTAETGLSIVIPCLSEAINEETLVAAVVTHYYFSVLAGDLEVEIGTTVINKSTFMSVAADIQAKLSEKPGEKVPFEFVAAVSRQLGQGPLFTAVQDLGAKSLDKSFFSEDDLAKMKERFSQGELVGVRVPVLLRPAGEGSCKSYIDLYLKGLPDGDRSYALFSRGMIVLPGERRYFQGTPAYGAMIARDDGIAAFLGDAENPAHTAWNSKAEKLAMAWKAPMATLSRIRGALKHLYSLVAEQVEAMDRNALLDFFSLADAAPTTKGAKKRTPKPKISIPASPKAISIRPKSGGFEIVAGPGASGWTYPKSIRVRVAYDMIGANPFNHHSKFDFDFTESEISFVPQNAAITPAGPNVFRLSATSQDFAVEVKGFDLKRDLVVDARAV